MVPRNPAAIRDAPQCRRCGKDCEPGDFVCWSCGSEELLLNRHPVPHVYLSLRAGQAPERVTRR